MSNEDLDLYLYPTYFIDSDNPEIKEKAKELTIGMEDEVEKIKNLFFYSRDSIQYSPYNVSFEHKLLKASYVLKNPIKKRILYSKSRSFCSTLQSFWYS